MKDKDHGEGVRVLTVLFILILLVGNIEFYDVGSMKIVNYGMNFYLFLG